MNGRRTLWIAAALLFVAAGLYLPASLFFPRMLFFSPSGDGRRDAGRFVDADPAEMEDVIARADARVRASAIFEPAVLRRPVFLTDGGFRWRILSFGAGTSFGLTRSLGGSTVINRSNAVEDRVWNSAGRCRRAGR